MPAILLFLKGLIPTKDLVIGALVIGLAVFCYHLHDKYVTAIQYATTVKAESVVALQQRDAEIAQQKSDYQTSLTKEQQQHVLDNQTNSAQHDADVNSMRIIATSLGKGSAVLPSSAFSSTWSVTGGPIPAGMGNVFADANMCSSLAADLRQARSDLTLAYAERDSLVRK